MPNYLKICFFTLLLLVAALSGRADTLTLKTAPTTPYHLEPYSLGWKDLAGAATAISVFPHPERFVPLKDLRRNDPTQVYWLKVLLKEDGSIQEPLVLSFNHLTFVDAFLYRETRLLWQRQAGAFRPINDIRRGDSRFHMTFPPLSNGSYTLLLRVQHTKGYQPNFDFALQGKEAYLQARDARERADAWSQGAVGIFLLYTLLSWWGSRYRPYLWLCLFILGVGMYSLCSGRYFIDWFFPQNPALGWLFNGPFLHLGLLGFYQLIILFWELPKYNPAIYRFGKLCIGVLVTVSVSSFCLNYFTGNFNLANTLNLWAFLFPFSFTLALLVSCYRRLNRAQRYLYYGIALFLVSGLFITLSSALIKEAALLYAPSVSNFTSLAVFLLFAAGLKEALRQHEIDKGVVLEHLSRLQQEQNTLLEQKVAQRTEELLQSNSLLQNQSALLAQRNRTIETLINELSHRVKNNLQLLYSLFSLQLPHVKDQQASQVLNSNMARIKAMMIVNQKLNYTDEANPIQLKALAIELVSHLQAIYDRPANIQMRLEIDPAINLHGQQVLPVGLILTELLTNSFKHAFGNCSNPVILVTVTTVSGSSLEMIYADNGAGFNRTGKVPHASMGLFLVKDLVRQLHGTLHISGQEGLRYSFIIPVKQPSGAGNPTFVLP